MIQHDQRSRWKAWMRMFVIGIRPSVDWIDSEQSLQRQTTRPSVQQRG
jgi:hypothetical protein